MTGSSFLDSGYHHWQQATNDKSCAAMPTAILVSAILIVVMLLRIGSMLLQKLLISFVLLSTGFNFAPSVSAATFQDKDADRTNERKTLPPEYRLKLDYEDSLLREYIGVPPKQSAQLDQIQKEWAAERKGLLDQGATSREQYRAFAARESQCEDLLTKDQLEKELRYYLITSICIREISTLERAVAAGDIVLAKAQPEKIEKFKSRWLRRFDKNLVLPHQEPTEDRDKRWELIDKRDRVIEAVRRELETDYGSDLKNCLSQEQLNRVSQIRFQFTVMIRAMDIFNDPAIAEELELTREQKAQLSRLNQEISNEPDDLSAFKIKLEGYPTIFEALSSRQKNVWRKKLGAPSWIHQFDWLAKHIESDLESIDSSEDR